MPRINTPLLAFNRGLVSSSALARIDVERVRLSAEVYQNWTPKTQGAMLLRAGLKYLGSSRSELPATWMDFVAATEDTAIPEVTTTKTRIWISDTLLTRPAVTTSISNSSFATSTSWTDASTGGGTLTFGGTGLILNAVNRGGNAVCTRQITTIETGTEHSLAINVTRGPITFRCGSSAGGEQYVEETSLGTGRHSLAFTPTGDFHLTISSDLQVNRIVASLAVEASGVVEITSPWVTGDLGKMRWTQSADVMFVACEGYKQQRIERRGTGRSWSVVDYEALDGPFQAVRNSKVRLKPSVTFGNGTLTSDLKFFKTSHVGAMFRLFHPGHKGVFYLGREDTYTDPIRVTGVNVPAEEDPGPVTGYSDRSFAFHVAGTWVGTLTLQRSFDDPDTGYLQFRSLDRTTNGDFDTVDQDDNSIVYYRVGFLPGDYTSGSAHITADYSGGGDFGICRVTAFNSATSVDIEVLKDFNSTEYTEDWREGLWSNRKGWPTAVAIHEGRMWWAGKVYIVGSVSDAYDSFDVETEGDSGPIIRTIGSGPVDVVNWLLPLQRLLFGTAGAETSAKSSSFDEPLTPQAFGMRDAETQGSAKLPAAKVGKRGVFVQRSKKRVFELIYSSDVLDYDAKELTLLVPDITGTATITGVAVQRQPDTRIHFTMSDGDVLILTYEPQEDVLCWSRFHTDGDVEKIVVLPGDEEDRVYYHINRTINGSTVRYLEKWALESECKGAVNHRQLDCYVAVAGPVSTITGATHLALKQIAVWANGQCLEDTDGTVKLFTVSAGGNVVLGASYTNITYGLPYDADWKSSKLAYAAGGGTALNQMKRAAKLGLILGTCHYRGLRAGRDFDHLDNLPLTKGGTDVVAHTVFTEYDEAMRAIPGNWDTDSRLYLRASAPRVCEVLAAVVDVNTSG